MKPMEILEKMPKELNDIEKARYIYIELGKYFSYDERYLTAETLDDKRLIFDRDINNIDDNKAICSSISKIYVKLLNEAGIKAETVYEEAKFCGHMFTKISIDDREYRADLVHDLLEIKKGFKTKNFMKNGDNEKYSLDFSEIEDEELFKIDKKIGYCKNEMYMEDVIQMLKEEVKLLKDNSSVEAIALKKELGVEDLTYKELFEYIIDFVGKYCVADNLNCIDKADYFHTILKEIVEDDEVRKYDFNKISCVENEDKMRIFLAFEDKEEGDKLIYTFSDIDYVKKVNGEYIREKLNEGMRTLSKREDVKDFLFKFSENNSLQSRENIIQSAIKTSESVVKASTISEQENIIDDLELQNEKETSDEFNIK